MTTLEGALLTLVGLSVAVPLAAMVAARPQRGLLAIAALLPFDGLLLLVPDGERWGAWKEVALVGVAMAAIACPRSARRASGQTRSVVAAQPWAPAALAYALLTVAIAGVTLLGGHDGPGVMVTAVGLKVDLFYLLVPVVLWRCPFDEGERDRLVSILMGTGLVVVLVGLAQQVAGPERLHSFGYEYNDAIRFSGGLLRSFSTFTQPFSFGFFVMVVLLVGLPAALADLSRLRNRLFILVTPVLVLGMAASVVRGAMLGLVAGLCVLAWWRHRGLVHVLVPVGLVCLALPATVLGPLASGSSLGQRTAGWSQIGGFVVDGPLGNGVGVTGAAAAKAVELGAPTHQVLTVAGAPYQPDNYFVKTLLELGPLGLWLLLLVGAAAVAVAVDLARSAPAVDQPLAAGVAATIVAAAAASCVSTYLEIFPLDFLFWLLLGVLLCLGPPSNSMPSRSAQAVAACRPTSESSSSP